MPSARSTALPLASTKRAARFTGLFFDEFAPDSAWIREEAKLQLPAIDQALVLTLRGEFRPHPAVRGLESSSLSLETEIDGIPAGRIPAFETGTFALSLSIPAAAAANQGAEITLRLRGTTLTNALAWLGRVVPLGPLQRFRAQNKNRQLRIQTITTANNETVFDFGRRDAPFSQAFVRRHTPVGINIVGFLTADLGVGESARCMVRAADADAIPSALVPLRLHCKNRLGDQTYAGRLQDTNPYDVNVIHIDAPAARDIDHHHGADFRAGKYNIAYWAWELMEFPDAWVPNFDFFQEIWTPSDFVTAAIAMKSPVPVLTMPHAISFARPDEGTAALRRRFGLPAEKFLFLFLCDLNSYSARKNPQAVLAAFRASGLAGRAGLVIKVQNAAGNESDFAALHDAVRDLPDAVLVSETLSRSDISRLESACDCFVSLHRSEGFGLALAECMYLGKPVIATDWSATAEYLTPATGCPVRAPLVPIEKNQGPYARGQYWADPDISHAAEWMQRLHHDRTFAATIGTAGRAAIEARFSPAVIGARYRRRLEAIAGF